MMGYSEVSLAEMIKELGEEEVKQLLSDFLCPQNKDVEYFLKYRAVEFAKQSIAQTQLVFMQYKGQIRLVGYYTLTYKSISIKDEGLSNTMRKRISKFGTRDTSNKGYVIPAPLIAQLGKNFSDGLNTLITGDELLKMALDKISFAHSYFGGKVIYIECEDKPRLVQFYNNNGFVQFGKREMESEDEGRIEGKHLLQLLKISK